MVEVLVLFLLCFLFLFYATGVIWIYARKREVQEIRNILAGRDIHEGSFLEGKLQFHQLTEKLKREVTAEKATITCQSKVIKNMDQEILDLKNGIKEYEKTIEGVIDAITKNYKAINSIER